jgi:hypothetical protein
MQQLVRRYHGGRYVVLEKLTCRLDFLVKKGRHARQNFGVLSHRSFFPARQPPHLLSTP